METKNYQEALVWNRGGIRLAAFKFIYQVHKTRTVYSSTRCNKSRYKTYTEYKWINKDTAKLGPRHQLGRSTENVQKQRTHTSVMVIKMEAICFSEIFVPFSQATRCDIPDDHNLDVPCEI